MQHDEVIWQQFSVPLSLALNNATDELNSLPSLKKGVLSSFCGLDRLGSTTQPSAGVS